MGGGIASREQASFSVSPVPLEFPRGCGTHG